MDKMLSLSEIRSVLKNSYTVNYNKLKMINDIENIFKHSSLAIMFYVNGETSSCQYGHWNLLINKPDSIEFFDSYGQKPDQILLNRDKSYMEKFGQEMNKLAYLLSKSTKKIYYNEIPFQKESENVNTCGRHIIIRGLLEKLSLEQYQKLMKKLAKNTDYSFDQIVLILTNILLS